MKNPRDIATKLLGKADIQVNGSRPWDVQVHDERAFARILRGGRLALGESYMDGWWDVEQLDEFIARALRANLHTQLKKDPKLLLNIALATLTNRQSRARAFEVGEQHYDIGNDLYERMLDPWMQYSCGYWKEGVSNLADAQVAKMDLICRKLELTPGMRVLDVGCGWGGLARFMARNYKVSVVGLTVSKEQAAYAKAHIGNLSVEVKVTDYRAFAEKNDELFDAVVSVGMFEHVGYKNYRTYMEHMHSLLKNDGLFLLHTIGGCFTTRMSDPWFDKYIFPNGMLPSVQQIGVAAENLFIMEDWHNFGADYDKTLMAWYENFERAWPELKATGKYDDRFYRMWRYYLLTMAGAFRSRVNNQLWQVVFSKNGVLGGYRSKR